MRPAGHYELGGPYVLRDGARPHVMKVEYLATDDPRWTVLLGEVPHDVYHLPEYLNLCVAYEGTEGTDGVAFYAHDGSSFCLIPLLLRPLPSSLNAPREWRDVTSPYGYAAPLFRGDERWAREAMDAFAADCRRRDIVSVFLRLHPLLTVPSVLGRFGQLVKHGETVYVDVTLPEATLWSQTRARLRSYISKLKRAGLYTRFDDWSQYGKFVEVYSQTMARLGADQFYQFPEEYFRDLRAALGDRLHLCSVVDAHGDLVCAAVLTSTQGIVQYHLSGTANEFLDCSPSKLMLHEIAMWAKQTGHKVLHLGGGLGGHADSLLYFKTGFSPLRSDFLTYRLICDADKYRALCEHLDPASLPDSYFPRYRLNSGSQPITQGETNMPVSEEARIESSDDPSQER